jgi:PAS domain S-box-containing protein
MGSGLQQADPAEGSGVTFTSSAPFSTIGTPSSPDDIDNVALRSMYAQIVAASLDAIYSYDLSGSILTWNASAEKLFGYTSAEVIGQDFARLIPADRAQEYVTILKNGEAPFDLETERLKKDGSLVLVHLTVSPVRNAAQNVVAFAAIARDITGRKQADDTLRKSEERYRTIIETAHEGIWIIDVAGCTTFVNQRIANMLGYSQAEIMGRVHTDFMWEEDRPKGEADLELRRQGVPRVWDQRYRRKDDSALWTVASCNAMFDPEGKLVGTLGMFTDITERKRAEATVARQLRELDTLYATSPTGLFHFDADLRFVRVNAWTAAINGRSIEAHIGQTVGDVMNPETAGKVDRLLRQVLQSGEPLLDVELHGTTAAHVVARDWLASYYPVRNSSGEVVGVHGVVLDITARKQAEDLLRTSEERVRKIIDSMPTFVGMIAPDGTLTEANHAALAAAGLSRSDVIGKPFWDCYWWNYDPAVQERLRAGFDRAVRGEIVRYEETIRVGDDKRAVLDFVLKPVFDGERLRFVIPSAEDITERKRAGVAVRASERRYRRLFEAAHDGVLILNADTGKITDANPFMLDALGVARAELMGQELWQIGFLGDETESRAAFARLKKEGQIRYENLPLESKTGARREVEVVANVYDEGGNPVIQCNVRDISERVQATKALRESGARLKMALNAANAGAWEAIPASKQFFASDQALGLYGLAPGTVMSFDKAWAVVLPEDRERLETELRRTLKTGAPFRVEFRAYQPDGSFRWLQSQAELRPDLEGGRLVGLVQDITEQKQREHRIQLLMQEVNHRSKNLLSVVMSIARQTGDPDNREFVKRLGDRIEGLALSHDLLARNEWQSIDLDSLIRAQLSYFKSLFGTRITICGEAANLSSASAQTIGLALHELATNAAKYGAMSDDKGRIAISWEVTGTAGSLDSRFAFSWRESDGPQVVVPTRRGFGSTVTGRMVKVSLGSEVSAEYAPTGFVWHLNCPAENVLEK